MPLHILTAIALLSAAHQGIQVAASSSNLGAPSSKTAAIPKKRYLRSSASAQDLVATGSQVAGTLVRDGGQESLIAGSAADGDSSSSEIEAAAIPKKRYLRASKAAQNADACAGLKRGKCNKEAGCEYKKKQCQSTAAGDACAGLKKSKCKKTEGCEYKKKNKKCKSTKK